MIDQPGLANGAASGVEPPRERSDDRRIVPLDQVSRSELTEVLEDERLCWARELDWDFTHTADVIERSLETRGVSGFALCEAGRIVAYSYYIAGAERSHVGSVHALPEAEQGEAASQLLDRCLTHLTRELPARRVESQFLYFGGEEIDRVFANHDFRRFERQFLRGSVATVRGRLERDNQSDDVELTPFRFAQIRRVAEVVRAGFRGSVDAEMSECYATSAGCVSFVEGVTMRNGCGSFDTDASFVATRSDGALVGIVLASSVSATVGHIVQLSVRPSEQGRGIGRRLLTAACDSMASRFADRVSLSVSAANQRAGEWYRSLGLEVVKDFSAWLWSR